MPSIALSPDALAETVTLVTNSMGDPDGSFKTYRQMPAIYRSRSRKLDPTADASKDLRVDDFIDDMAHGRWRTPIVVTLGLFDSGVVVVDGVHRGIAYLACIDKGIAVGALPELRLAY